ncbi:MAG: GDSL-type esterase/lipase family protein [Kiritimatiellia bacterium]|nr:GDSL-type esterase/lipase family protein [Kiritimatiellia bacterium]
MKTDRRLLAAAFAVLLGCAVSGAYEFKTERDIRYSDASGKCVLDLKWPAEAKGFATVVNLHGGGLTGGGRHFAPWPEEAKDKDPVAHVAVQYRLLPTDGSGVVQPADCIADAAASVAWTLKNIGKYGGDPKKVFVTGISAGGYLTAMVGLDARWMAPHGFKPGDLAGIVPLTGQMTKHFNVRKIGFRDTDPQFLPKIDEWAPLFHAGAKGLPPASFCTGGRDVEWKCRVEENELLAVSLRNCGYPKTEFHETEGDHGGGVAESVYFLRDFVMKTADAGGVARFEDGERVVFFGDSITHDGGYVHYLQLFQNLRNPGCGTRLLNGGISGDSAGGGVARWEDDILPMKPSRVFVMFGMNDVGRDQYATPEPDGAQAKSRADALARYEANQRALAEKIPASGVKAVFVTPSPYDQYTNPEEKGNLAACNEPGLSACAEIVRKLAAEKNFGTVDFHAPMTRMFRDHPEHRFCGDRVHPGHEGHLVMAALVLDAMRVSPVLARAVIDAAKGAAEKVGSGRTKNAVLTRVAASPKRVAFTYAPKALPFPKLPEYVKTEAFYPLTEKLNREEIVVKGLEEGAYALRFDGAEVGRFTAAEFAKGVNIALLDTPNQKRALDAAKPLRELQALESRLRTHALVCGRLRQAQVNPEDRAAADRWLDDWLVKNAAVRWIGAYRSWAQTYRDVREEKPALDARAEDLRERIASARPAVSRVTIEK